MYEYKGNVIRVVDGDTIDVILDLGFDITQKIRIRLKGIDTPETYRPSCDEEKKHGLAAKQFVIDNIYNKSVIVQTYKDHKGKYGRYLADIVFDNNKSIVESLKRNGFEKKSSYEGM